MPTIFETERLVLRRLLPDDAPVMFAYRSVPVVTRYQNWEPASVEEIDRFIADQAAVEPGMPGPWCQLAIVEKNGGPMVGDLGLHTVADDERQTIQNMRKSYREALREGIIDSKEDVDLILLAKELDALLVTADRGAVKWAEKLGIRWLLPDRFKDYLTSFLEDES